jgi:hypothetical protein
MTTTTSHLVRPFVALPSDDDLAKARAALLAFGFTDDEVEVETGLGLRRLPNCPPKAPIVVKVAAGALSLVGARAALDAAKAAMP